MYPPEVRAKALELVAAGLNDCEIARRLGILRRTILDWRRPTYVSRRNGRWSHARLGIRTRSNRDSRGLCHVGINRRQRGTDARTRRTQGVSQPLDFEYSGRL
jgi:hypothetical protein